MVGLIENSVWKDLFLLGKSGPAIIKSGYTRGIGVHKVYNCKLGGNSDLATQVIRSNQLAG